MDFFRRIFNNPSDDESSEEGSTEQAQPIQTQEDAVANSSNGDDDTPTAPLSEKNDDTAEENEIVETLPVRPPQLANVEEVDTQKVDPVPDEMPLGVTRPLPQDPTLSKAIGHLSFGQASDTGMVRTNNQDAALSFFFTSDSVDDHPDFGVFVVADGMGGHKEGEKASALTARIIVQEIFTKIYMPMINDDELDSDRPTITEVLSEAVVRANAQIKEDLEDGGTTMTGIVVLGDQAYIGHVGDSRAYLITQNGGLEQLTRDHSVVQRLIELEQLTPEEAETHEQRNVLYRAIGQNEQVEVDILRRRLTANSQILICSDGLWGMVNNDDLLDIIINTPDPQESCEKLIARANTNGGTDNITAVLLKVPG